MIGLFLTLMLKLLPTSVAKVLQRIDLLPGHFCYWHRPRGWGQYGVLWIGVNSMDRGNHRSKWKHILLDSPSIIFYHSMFYRQGAWCCYCDIILSYCSTWVTILSNNSTIWHHNSTIWCHNNSTMTAVNIPKYWLLTGQHGILSQYAKQAQEVIPHSTDPL